MLEEIESFVDQVTTEGHVPDLMVQRDNLVCERTRDEVIDRYLDLFFRVEWSLSPGLCNQQALVSLIQSILLRIELIKRSF